MNDDDEENGKSAFGNRLLVLSDDGRDNGDNCDDRNERQDWDARFHLFLEKGLCNQS